MKTGTISRMASGKLMFVEFGFCHARHSFLSTGGFLFQKYWIPAFAGMTNFPGFRRNDDLPRLSPE
jgi:hypothetical protein